MTTAKFLGRITLDSVSFSVQRLNGGDLASYPVTLTDGDYYLSDDGTATDLIKEIEDEVHTAGGAAWANFEMTITSAGLVGMKIGSGELGVLTWSTRGEELRDWLRYSGASENLSITYAYGDRCHAFGFYPAKCIVEDLPIQVETKSVSVADDGTIETHWYASRQQRAVRIRYAGGPESTSWVEMYALDDLWDDCWKVGREFRFYRDTATTTAWVRKTNPDGYRTWVILGPQDREPTPLQAGWYAWFEDSFTFGEYV